MVLPGAIATPIWDKAKDQAAAVDSLLTPELAERYSGPIEKMAELIAQQESAGIPPEKVADAVKHTITSKRPRYRYYVGADAKVSGRSGGAPPTGGCVRSVPTSGHALTGAPAVAWPPDLHQLASAEHRTRQQVRQRSPGHQICTSWPGSHDLGSGSD